MNSGKWKLSVSFLFLAALAPLVSPLAAQQKLKVIIDQDCAGPGGTDMQAVLAIVIVFAAAVIVNDARLMTPSVFATVMTV